MIKALITVYHPAPSVKENVQRIAGQVDKVYICDNSPSSNEKLLSECAENIVYEFFGENLGLSLAFNRILKRENEFNDNDFVIFFDQDSTVEEEHIAKLSSEYKALENKGINIGCLAPVFFNTSNGTVEIPKMKEFITENSFKVASVITSSLLCRYSTIKDVGFWNERVFLDMADWDFSWRIRKAGKSIVMTDLVTLKHSLGTGEKKVGPLKIRVGSPFREYYQTRECLYLLCRRYTPFKFRLRFIAQLTVRPVIHLLFLDDRKSRFKYIIKGFKDFFGKKPGALKF